MGRSCQELWKNIHFVLKIIVFAILLCIHLFFFDTYAACHRFYAFGTGYFYTGFINIVIILYGYTWFDTTFIWECCMIIFTILMLLISTFALVHDYYDDDETSIIYTNRTYRHNERSFGISVGLSTIAVVILVIDLLLLIIKTGRKGSNPSRGRGTRQQQANRPVEADD